MSRDMDDSTENVLSGWSRRADPPADADEPERKLEPEDEGSAWGTAQSPERPELVEVASASTPAPEDVAGSEAVEPVEPEPEVEPERDLAAPMTIELSHEHAAGDLEIPDGYAVLEGVAEGERRAVGVVVARFNGEVTSHLLERALGELEIAGVRREAITIMVVPGAFELPLAATALAKTRRFACIVALGCVIRGDTPHFDYVASEAASGLQLAALETGVPVSFGVLTLDRIEQADPRVEKGAEAVRSALEMADVFSQLRAAASR
ncbi:MAG TPA: 6,7-dimethyl-8-ribityllumazine synthase [Gaiellaceae bacterium]|nr:6,7-dimethyl-8-ribityllumazine synthase [Gaiellaceae bacterium]